jgi:hypothetical protein
MLTKITFGCIVSTFASAIVFFILAVDCHLGVTSVCEDFPVWLAIWMGLSAAGTGSGLIVLYVNDFFFDKGIR